MHSVSLDGLELTFTLNQSCLLRPGYACCTTDGLEADELSSALYVVCQNDPMRYLFQVSEVKDGLPLASLTLIQRKKLRDYINQNILGVKRVRYHQILSSSIEAANRIELEPPRANLEAAMVLATNFMRANEMVMAAIQDGLPVPYSVQTLFDALHELTAWRALGKDIAAGDWSEDSIVDAAKGLLGDK